MHSFFIKKALCCTTLNIGPLKERTLLLLILFKYQLFLDDLIKHTFTKLLFNTQFHHKVIVERLH